ncbi:MAG: helix-turn-helix domain-containing protein [Gammaproteobacteria bacterium]
MENSEIPVRQDENIDQALEIEGASVKALEVAIGRQVRTFRKRLNLTVANVAKQAQLSSGMLSKIENGLTSPSLATLNALANALHVPVTSLFRGYEEQRDVTFIKSGEGLPIERRGSGAGHQYQLLGHTIGKPYTIEPYVITISDKSEVFPVFQHAGMELIYMLEGKVTYRHANKTYTLEPGDTLFFDAESSHGPDEILKLPCRYLSFIVSQSSDS